MSALRIDREELGFALTWRMDEGRHFFDRETGEVIAWTGAFVETVAATGWRRGLEDALADRGPFRRFKEVLASHPAERERWFAFHDERVREAAREWLVENGIEALAVSPPPDSR